MPAGRVLLFWSIIIYRRSIIIYLDRHVIFPSYIPYERLIILDERSILITSLVYYLSVDHNLPSVDQHLPYSPCQFFLHIYPMYGRSYLTNPCVFAVKLISFFHPIYYKIGCKWGNTSRSIMIYLDRNVIFSERSIILVTYIFSVKYFLFPIRYGP